MSKSLRILVDMDSIIADFLGGLWDAVEADIGFRPRTEDVRNFYKMEAALSDEAKEAMAKKGKTIESYFHEPGFFRNLKPLDGAIEVLKLLMEDGHEVVIVTSPSSKTSIPEKLEWLAEHCPFILPKEICCFSSKHMIQGDVLIDDAGHNAQAYHRAWPDALIVGLAYPYNAAYPGFDALFEGPHRQAWIRIYGAVTARAHL